MNVIGRSWPPRAEKLSENELAFAIFYAWWPSALFLLAISLLGAIATYVQPVLLDSFLGFFASYGDGGVPQPKEVGVTIAVAGLLANLLTILLTTWSSYLGGKLGITAQSALTSLIVQKSMILSPSAKKEFTAGAIMTRVTADVSTLAGAFNNVATIWTGFWQIIFGTAIVYTQLRWPTFVGIGLLLLNGPLSTKVGGKVGYWMGKKNDIMDTRMTLTQELFRSIKMVKAATLEGIFTAKVEEIRRKELVPIKTRAKANMLMFFFGTGYPTVAYLIMLVVYSVSTLPTLDANRVFVSLVAFQLFQTTLSHMPHKYGELRGAFASLKRVQNLLVASEVSSRDTLTDEITSVDATLKVPNHNDNIAISIVTGTFSWAHITSPTLSSINLSVNKGELVIVVGPTGAGKSTLLASILGDVESSTGVVHVSGRIAYVAQKPWILNDTVKGNILLGEVYDEAWFRKVTRACGLVPDIHALSDGVDTSVGDKGGTLSGGQQARLSIARAVYRRDADIYLLDDPFSALDAHVATHVYNQLLGKGGLLSGKTVVLVTHAEKFLPFADQIVRITDGSVSEHGSPRSLGLEPAVVNASVDLASGDVPDDQVKWNASEVKEDANVEKASSKANQWSAYLRYFKACSTPVRLAWIFTNLLNAGITLGSRFFLAYWQNDINASGTFEKPLGIYLAGFGALTIVASILSFVPMYIFMGFAGIQASATIHASMFRRLIHMPLRFFDDNPLGRIANRLSDDLEYVDIYIPPNVHMTAALLLILLIDILPAIITLPIVLLPVAVTAIGFGFLAKIFLNISTPVNRHSMIMMSPIASSLIEVAEGSDTIRAFGLRSHFLDKVLEKVSDRQRYAFLNVSLQAWLSILTQLCGAFLVAAVGIVAVLSPSSVSSASAGLMLTYLMSITQDLNMFVVLFSFLGAMTAPFGRVIEYMDLVQEKDLTEPAVDIPAQWPTEGRIEFRDYSLRYTEDAQPVLKNLTLVFEAGSKIGVCGRTGAGKSSLAQALLHFIDYRASAARSTTVDISGENSEPLLSGSILIDGIDIDSIPSSTLRSKVGLVTQEPVLFSQTIRFNMDPFNEHTDQAIWAVLEDIGLKKYVQDLEGGLDHKVEEGGSNFSVGQRQILSLGRAVLRDAKIIILDEATASVDSATDAAMQRIITTRFAGKTVISIAHRIDTICASDKVLVLDAGTIQEFDDPRRLLVNKSSAFAKLHERQ
ncbi:P-loop containing nucleoside triphosphate hydrolase protein [Fimicolochytrium jonesii]|uniref:P-loop containing nucleoside triphosphate hydrolase protein n=1 Tax=Fimicolochytrium jonesii TaxID=1396493 RepID=UPI0022FEAF5A|nr:P-loop containing nucleoside triphosphate hydrolase protein [Fimicolochytrium jonesii]KAI8825573.1 P-loop containing nucleoside triphosphate hydrolase protein [Fimicolochytrium jonesii]